MKLLLKLTSMSLPFAIYTHLMTPSLVVEKALLEPLAFDAACSSALDSKGV